MFAKIAHYVLWTIESWFPRPAVRTRQEVEADGLTWNLPSVYYGTDEPSYRLWQRFCALFSKQERANHAQSFWCRRNELMAYGTIEGEPAPSEVAPELCGMSRYDIVASCWEACANIRRCLAFTQTSEPVDAAARLAEAKNLLTKLRTGAAHLRAVPSAEVICSEELLLRTVGVMEEAINEAARKVAA